MACSSVIVIVISFRSDHRGNDIDHSVAPKKQANSAVNRERRWKGDGQGTGWVRAVAVSGRLITYSPFVSAPRLEARNLWPDRTAWLARTLRPWHARVSPMGTRQTPPVGDRMQVAVSDGEDRNKIEVQNLRESGCVQMYVCHLAERERLFR